MPVTCVYSLTQVHEETGVLLIKPMDLIPRLEDIKEDVKQIDEADILQAVNIPKERAKRRKSDLMAQAAAAKELSLSAVEGTGVPYEKTQGSSWKVLGNKICIPGELLVSLSGFKFDDRNLLVLVLLKSEREQGKFWDLFEGTSDTSTTKENFHKKGTREPSIKSELF